MGVKRPCLQSKASDIFNFQNKYAKVIDLKFKIIVSFENFENKNISKMLVQTRLR